MKIPRITLSQLSQLGVQELADRLSQAINGAGYETSIVWAPGQPAGGNRVQTWEQVMSAVAASQAPVAIWIDRQPADPALSVPAGVYEMKEATIIGRKFGDLTEEQIMLADGAVLRNLRQISGDVAIVGNSTAAACLEWDTLPMNPAVFLISEGAALSNNGSHAMIDVSTAMVLVILNRGSYIAPPVPLAPCVALDVGTFLLTFVLNGVNQLDDTFVGGPGASMLVTFSDGTLPLPLPALPMFAGMVLNAGGSAAGGGGPTAIRPIPFISPLSTGTTYYDTDIVKPIWWDGATWVDVNGVPS